MADMKAATKKLSEIAAGLRDSMVEEGFTRQEAVLAATGFLHDSMAKIMEKGIAKAEQTADATNVIHETVAKLKKQQS